MKHLISIIALVLILTGIAHADAFFANRPLSALRVTQTSPEDGTAQVSAAGAATATVRIGDTVGQNGAAVIKISKLYVLVQTGKQKTKLPVVQSAVPDGNRVIFQ